MRRHFACLNCGCSLQVHEPFKLYSAGRTLNCPHCGMLMKVRLSESSILLGILAGTMGGFFSEIFTAATGLGEYSDLAGLIAGILIMLAVATPKLLTLART